MSMYDFGLKTKQNSGLGGVVAIAVAVAAVAVAAVAVAATAGMVGSSR